MYTLYVSRREKVIKVSKAVKPLQRLNYTDEVTRYNDVYYICSKRNPLVDKAREIKQLWISELEQELTLINGISI